MELSGFFNMDCMEGMKQIPDETVDLVVTSPPYDNLRTYNGNNDQWSESTWMSVINDLHRVIKPGGVVVWIVGDATVNGSETGTSFRQAIYAMDVGFNLHDTMIWQKDGFSAVGALASRYCPVFEYMFIFSKGKPKTFNPIKDRKNKWAGNSIHGTIRNDDGSIKPVSTKGALSEHGQRFNVWDINAEKSNKTGHPAPFPIQLASDHIKSWSNPGDIVLDPFTGSGTTAIACHNLNRKFIGFELDPDYYRMATERLETHKAQLNMFLDLEEV